MLLTIGTLARQSPSDIIRCS